MGIVVRMHWTGITPEQYDELRRRADWVGTEPAGCLVHVASFDRTGALHCCDVWAAYADFDEFLERRLFPAVLEAGIATEPSVWFEDCADLRIGTAAGSASVVAARPRRRPDAAVSA
jgi:hypothetical protein